MKLLFTPPCLSLMKTALTDDFSVLRNCGPHIKESPGLDWKRGVGGEGVLPSGRGSQEWFPCEELFSQAEVEGATLVVFQQIILGESAEMWSWEEGGGAQRGWHGAGG